jgi:polysaccharide export outer membrane protein
MKLVFTVAVLAGTVVGCVTTGSGGHDALEAAQAEELAEAQKRFVLGEGDVVEIKVFREPELAGTYRVTRDGLEFPLIGKVSAVDREAEAVGEEIRARLAQDYLKQPQVTVFVREHNSRKVHVLGNVNKPGSFAYESGMTVIQAVTNAGGFNKLAATNSVLVTRGPRGAEQKFTVPVGDIGRGNAPNFSMEPGDIVFVPESVF